MPGPFGPEFENGTPPPLIAPGQDAEDSDRQKDHDAILALFNPELRAILSRIPVRVADTSPYLGFYSFPNGGRGEIGISRYVGSGYGSVLRQELLHGANYEYEPFVSDLRRNMRGLFDALLSAYGGNIPPSLLQDPVHAFTFGAEQSLTNAENTPLDLYRYFLPLRQGVLTD